MLEDFFKGFHLRGSRTRPNESASEGLKVLLHGRDDYPLELVGTSRRRAEIHEMVGESVRALRDRRCVAVLAIEQDKAGHAGGTQVGVFVEGRLVGYLPRYLSTQYREWLHAWNLSRASVHCRALIQSDWNGAGPCPAEYRVKLDVEKPFRMTTIQF
jgi:hypothetical protein